MKGLFLAVLVGFLLVLFPSAGSADPSSDELEPFLKELGWTQEDLVEYLDFYEVRLGDFKDMEDLKEFLGEPLTEEHLQELLEEYGWTLEEAVELLMENGELEEGEGILEVYTFYDDLAADLYFYSMTPLTDELMKQLAESYEMSYEELIELLEQNDDSIDNYEYMEDLDSAVWYYLYGEEVDDSYMEGLFHEIGLTDEEMDRLLEHFMAIDLEDPSVLEKLDNLSERMMAFENFEAATELSAEQVAELLDIYTQITKIFQLDVSFYLADGEVKEPVSIPSLMAMQSSEGYDLLIELHNNKGDFLADLLFTGDMFEAELIKDTGEDLQKVEQVIQGGGGANLKEPVKPEPVQPDLIEERPVHQTEHGAKLPKTAAFSFEKIGSGLLALFLGFFLYRRMKYAQK
ncbi:processed acidic surface protein [Halobacillus halophilus]|uniref:processed acidic surface protein n=1 Tax=Halobacillus halophilus TaxID=1570 RepID=UPI001CD50D93|nr:processed acidic surface protein [Halobacillus halophilus]MCA1011999.1 processed acidic surface protein [Halobacillus halophilus]